MIVCYARGGGLGHLTRVRAYLHTVHPGAVTTIRTEWPRDPAVLARADEIVVDAFPAGLDGEIGAAVPRGPRVVHLARLLRWEAYRPLIQARPLRFHRTWLAEPVSDPHLAYLESVSDEVVPLALADPPAAPATAPGDWLIVHSGPPGEILELVAYARESAVLEGLSPRLVLVSPAAPPGLPAGVAHLAVSPAWPLFATAGRIVSAAGFNVVRQAAPYRHKHRMVPFPRRFDDQFTRAARARRERT
ncbi:hypothetical protein [Nonomuraea aurantiaca]|uniref:hypothetical protein n=1 Tax=Nonomuraea aurantiaca TaxID=2878562 RepID=UPI001CD91A24|nr:hypothetical protein [Nonomuraea aurantiaca]MCA2219731.1 hypothetical protein [Nonomuraea aurantiaca]